MGREIYSSKGGERDRCIEGERGIDGVRGTTIEGEEERDTWGEREGSIS